MKCDGDLESFWEYLKRQLAANGAIRGSRLPLYLAEYVWRYNHRGDSRGAQLTRLLQLLRSVPSSVPGIGLYPFLKSLYQFDFPRPPGLVEEGLKRPV